MMYRSMQLMPKYSGQNNLVAIIVIHIASKLNGIGNFVISKARDSAISSPCIIAIL